MNNNNLNFSVIIPTWNRKNALIETLESLYNQSKYPDNFEIIICDSLSKDGTNIKVKEYIQKNSTDNLRLINAEHNNVSLKRNLGIQESKYEIVLLLDDDCVPFEDYFSKNILAFQATDNKTILCGEYRVDDSLLKTSNYYRFRDSRNHGSIYENKKKSNTDFLGFQRIVTGNLGFRKEIIIKEKILFNSSIIGYGFEDVEWGYRLEKAGFRILKSNIKVIHNETSMNLSKYKMKWYYAANGAIPLLIKNNLQVAKKLPMFILESGYPMETSKKVYGFFIKLFLIKKILKLVEFILIKFDSNRFFYIPILFKYVLLGAYYEGIKNRGIRYINQYDTKKGWYSKGYK